eukprot:TRINITY_DN5630_c0_g1_i1.p1 TRINITY_DN5630_c0_g1~~TRINITY_DN5630_c0_g1_i1.p1  ORF type:complete len:147 (-),score=17.45 TRINITY_DN5630_c0_g1_i1:43-483(-)
MCTILLVAFVIGTYLRITNLNQNRSWTDLRSDPPLVLGTILFFFGILSMSLEWKWVTFDQKKEAIIFSVKHFYSWIWPNFRRSPIPFADIDTIFLEKSTTTAVLEKNRLVVKNKKGSVIPLETDYYFHSPARQQMLNDVQEIVYGK